MASEIYYECGYDKSVIDFHDADKAFLSSGSGIHARTWNRKLGYKGVSSVSKPAIEVKTSYLATDEQADVIRGAFDMDVNSGTPGTFVYRGWSTRCYVFDESTAARYAGWVKRDATIAMIDGFWYRDKSKHFVTGLDSGGIDHPYDYPHDLSYTAGKGQLIVETRLGAKPRITFYGPVTNPYITFAGNRYEVDVQVLSGWKVVIDAFDSTPTVRKVDSYGNYTSVFADAVRTGGVGGGSYAFEHIPYGTHEVAWSGAFSFDIEWRELETEPPWDV